MAKQRIEPEELDAILYRGGVPIATPESRPEVRVQTPADIAAERKSLMERAAELEEKLVAGKQSEFEKLSKLVVEFNGIFNEAYELMISPAPAKVRKCSVCHQPGHRAKACPTKAAGGAV
jgi:hypothetical protein